MKVFALGLIVFIAAFVVACSGGEEDSFRQYPSPVMGEDPAESSLDDQITQDGVVLTEQGACHDAIDNTPAADPIKRDEGYLAVAKALSASYLTEAVSSLDYTMRFKTGDYADFVVVGIFTDPSGEGEKEAYFSISKVPLGCWILDDTVIPDFTRDERNYRRDLERIEEYKAALAVFDTITVSVVSAEVTADQWFETKNFVIQIDNPTNQDHEVDYLLQWTVTSEDSRCGNPEDEKRGRENVAASSTVSVEVESVTNLFGSFRYCGNPSLEKARVAVARVDGYVREKVEQRLADLQSQTSPP